MIEENNNAEKIDEQNESVDEIVSQTQTTQHTKNEEIEEKPYTKATEMEKRMIKEMTSHPNFKFMKSVGEKATVKKVYDFFETVGAQNETQNSQQHDPQFPFIGSRFPHQFNPYRVNEIKTNWRNPQISTFPQMQSNNPMMRGNTMNNFLVQPQPNTKPQQEVHMNLTLQKETKFDLAIKTQVISPEEAKNIVVNVKPGRLKNTQYAKEFPEYVTSKPHWYQVVVVVPSHYAKIDIQVKMKVSNDGEFIEYEDFFDACIDQKRLFHGLQKNSKERCGFAFKDGSTKRLRQYFKKGKLYKFYVQFLKSYSTIDNRFVKIVLTDKTSGLEFFESKSIKVYARKHKLEKEFWSKLYSYDLQKQAELKKAKQTGKLFTPTKKNLHLQNDGNNVGIIENVNLQRNKRIETPTKPITQNLQTKNFKIPSINLKLPPFQFQTKNAFLRVNDTSFPGVTINPNYPSNFKKRKRFGGLCSLPTSLNMTESGLEYSEWNPKQPETKKRKIENSTKKMKKI